MVRQVQELIQYKDLVRSLVARDLKVRYKNTVLGVFWSFLNPVVQVVVLTLVFKRVTSWAKGIENYSIVVFCGFLPWLFFQQAILDASDVISKNYTLVKKIAIPREILVFSSLISNFVHFLAALGVLFFILLVLPILYQDWPALHSFLLSFKNYWFLPIIILIQLILLYGLALITSTLCIFYADIKYILNYLLMLGLFVTPIFIPEAVVKEKCLYLFLANPMAHIISGFRDIFIHYRLPDPQGMGLALLIGLFALFLGYLIFHRYEWLFPELA